MITKEDRLNMQQEYLQDYYTNKFTINGMATLNVDTDLAQNIIVDTWVTFNVETMITDNELLNDLFNDRIDNISVLDIPYTDEYIVHGTDNKLYDGIGHIVKVNKVVNADNVSAI